MTGTGVDEEPYWNLMAEYEDWKLFIRIYHGATSPGLVEITEKDTDFSTCGNCIVLRTACTDSGECDSYMPRVGGQLRLEEMGVDENGRLKGSLENIVLQQVSFANDGSTTLVSDGQVYKLSSWSFDQQLTGQQTFCSGHGTLNDDGVCTCETDYKVDPDHATRCISALDCAGHGKLNGETCDCDEGYVVDSDDATLCVLEPVCSGHGHLHGENCHCDTGYVVDPADSSKCISE